MSLGSLDWSHVTWQLGLELSYLTVESCNLIDMDLSQVTWQ